MRFRKVTKSCWCPQSPAELSSQLSARSQDWQSLRLLSVPVDNKSRNDGLSDGNSARLCVSMRGSATVSSVVILPAVLLAAVGLAALALYLRDRIAKVQGKTPQQVQVRFSAILQFRSTLEWCIPGVLVIVFGIFYAIDRSRQHESDWWFGLPFIPAGWILIPLLARRSWHRYLELQRLAEKGESESNAVRPPPVGLG